MENENFEIENVIVRRTKYEMINYHYIPAYSSLYYINIIYKDDKTRWASKFHTFMPDPIDIECSVKDYYKMIKESIEEEIYNIDTLEELKTYIKNHREEMNRWLENQ